MARKTVAKKMKGRSKEPEVAYRKEKWSWSSLVELLADPNHQQRIWATRIFLQFLEAGFVRLRQDLEDPEGVISWKDPSILLCIEFPFQWESGEQPLLNEDEILLWNLRAVFEIMLAGVAVARTQEGKRVPMIPEPIARHLVGCSESECARILGSWLSSRHWSEDRLLDAAFTSPVDGNVVGKGSKNEVLFTADIRFALGQYTVDLASEKSYSEVRLGLPWSAPTPRAKPERWNDEERLAFWSAVSKFFEELIRRNEGETVPDRFRVPVSPANGSIFQCFEGRFIAKSGPHYFRKVTPPAIETSALGRIPPYARGAQGPVLDILCVDKSLHPLAPSRVMAAMAHPKESEFRKQLEASLELKVAFAVPNELKNAGFNLAEEEMWPVLQAELAKQFGFFSITAQRALASAPSLNEVLARGAARACGGSVAGEMLLFLLTCARYHPEHVSVKKAVYIQGFVLDGAVNGYGKEVTSNPSKIKEWWSQFRPVAHLWAAFEIWQKDLAQARELSPAEGLMGFLSIAEALRKEAESCFARAQRLRHGPILDPTETWRVSPELELENWWLTSGPLPEAALQLLREREKKSGRTNEV